MQKSSLKRYAGYASHLLLDTDNYTDIGCDDRSVPCGNEHQPICYHCLRSVRSTFLHHDQMTWVYRLANARPRWGLQVLVGPKLWMFPHSYHWRRELRCCPKGWLKNIYMIFIRHYSQQNTTQKKKNRSRATFLFWKTRTRPLLHVYIRCYKSVECVYLSLNPFKVSLEKEANGFEIICRQRGVLSPANFKVAAASAVNVRIARGHLPRVRALRPTAIAAGVAAAVALESRGSTISTFPDCETLLPPMATHKYDVW